MNRLLFALIAFIIFSFLTPSLYADDWAPAPNQMQIFSPNEEYKVEIIPDKKKYTETAKTEYYTLDRKKIYQKMKTESLRNYAPVFSLLTDEDELVTFDTWGGNNGQPVVIIYFPSQTVREYTLQDLYPPDSIKKFKTTTSSVWWRCNKHDPYIEAHTKNIIGNYPLITSNFKIDTLIRLL